MNDDSEQHLAHLRWLAGTMLCEIDWLDMPAEELRACIAAMEPAHCRALTQAARADVEPPYPPGRRKLKVITK
ncbi:hypothetical protein [Mycolicibacterium canariasense]|uniref:hypothetical protein n=1 Tax=Mycolicibacterium canariasense TaxID=228230 RepID=UPI000A89644E|nr:hypothetical protein [Mycolicibacterium canariasense]MCV7210338.1 hypothetical protein [Mycolicibacterium canariasense]